MAVAYPVAIHKYRVLYADGAVRDYLSHTADARFRSFAYETYYGTEDNLGNMVIGVADLGVVYTHIPEESPDA